MWNLFKPPYECDFFLKEITKMLVLLCSVNMNIECTVFSDVSHRPVEIHGRFRRECQILGPYSYGYEESYLLRYNAV
jgi:hypothetical protein